ncbi:Kunitz/Bovine pancreatic trypsin inhibitor domain protein [Teladorsagia circumcincta]|uniref:Kunitz/Bovine pancreatic trypsin inhibitor domain protein n=1 Tax=Teladorsagia circumcincta TaxID=45464 RepID=A0A2G9U2V8_TELCI|nr:Kunitz/Bovine pancreatic trypsin inhibitor domain protein [Teladorsagia circumcincta]
MSCNDGKEWTNRYYYDAELRLCRMYWHGGCFSYSKNDFPDQETCQWKCMGVHSAHASSEPEFGRYDSSQYDMDSK